jgi:hydroxypyruvate isomerase
LGNQEINYPAVMQAIDRTGFMGYVALEYVFREPIKESMKTSYNEYIK